MLPFRIGVIGCGKISDVYIQNCQRFDGLEIVACASLDIGESLAKLEMMVVVSRILQRYELRTRPDYRLQLEPGFALGARGGVPTFVLPRQAARGADALHAAQAR